MRSHVVKNVADLSHSLFTYATLVENPLFVLLSVFPLPVKMLYFTVFRSTDHFTFHFLCRLLNMLVSDWWNHDHALILVVFECTLNRLQVESVVFNVLKLLNWKPLKVVLRGAAMIMRSVDLYLRSLSTRSLSFCVISGDL